MHEIIHKRNHEPASFLITRHLEILVWSLSTSYQAYNLDTSILYLLGEALANFCINPQDALVFLIRTEPAENKASRLIN